MKYEKKVKSIVTKGLTKDLMNKFTIHDREKYFSAEIFQKCLVFISAKNT